LPDPENPQKDRKSVPIFDFCKLLIDSWIRRFLTKKTALIFHPWQAQGRTLSVFGNYRKAKNADI
jgi:hypothetical protein